MPAYQGFSLIPVSQRTQHPLLLFPARKCGQVCEELDRNDETEQVQ